MSVEIVTTLGMSGGLGPGNSTPPYVTKQVDYCDWRKAQRSVGALY